MATSSAIEIQISARVRAPKNGRVISENVVREAIQRKARTLQDIPGIDLRIVRWKHPRGRWHRASNSRGEWERFARFLPAASILIESIRALGDR